jgi:drug/metabolite transporter (DMT)-like permease
VSTHGIGLSGASAGDLITFVATISWSLYVSFGASVLTRHSPLRMTTWAIGLGMLWMIPLAALQLPAFDPRALTPQLAAVMAFAVLGSAALANTLMIHAVSVLGPARSMSITFLVPAVAVVLAYLLLGESIQLAQVLGGVVIVAGIAITRQGGLLPRPPTRWRRRPQL